MNAEELIDDVVDIIIDGFDRDWILRRLNLGMTAIAGRVLLPGLADGSATVTTLVDDHQVALPADYHRHIYLATVAGTKVVVTANVGLLRDFGFVLDNTVGPVLAVSTNAGKLVYQQVPSVATDIPLRYYRKPLLMTDSPTSFPDGLVGCEEISEQIDKALVGYVCSEVFSRKEQGLEGSTPDTNRYKNQFESAIAEIGKGVNKARPRPAPTICRATWP